ncbi:hypothetical protein [Burkholderia thailandensis]|uniref:hypothetical protein n=1 Tax=Burkholderia thailandensis TaxID=57975 RepID=UPI00140DDA19|nr:hypothetical protein [Burkholderia thailandensis]MBS2129696.1 hypothetical protein [Burkholderia thailandensis]MCS3400283.1 hypothetical protein [Burkholderia thailandensis]MCS6472779.1 hypothetical protein [Burkholderia thailandensis]MCS6477561.1 hypothetical protein [Burkholderia thailandensis]MCS6497392.1 hypothetical protein [Burkholderia thailandensis]
MNSLLRSEWRCPDPTGVGDEHRPHRNMRCNNFTLRNMCCHNGCYAAKKESNRNSRREKPLVGGAAKKGKEEKAGGAGALAGRGGVDAGTSTVGRSGDEAGKRSGDCFEWRNDLHDAVLPQP